MLQFLLYANATSSIADKVSEVDVASDSNISDVNEEELSEDNESDVEEPEDDQAIDTSISSPSDAKSDDVVEEDFESESFATPSETESEIDATLSTLSEAKKMLSSPRFGASDPNNIYMYFDIPTSTMHFTDDDTKELYRTSGTGISSITGNNIPSYLNSIGVTTSSSQPVDVLSVVFDADLYPTSTKDLFCYMSNLTSITNLNKLHTESVTTMEAMFGGTTSLTSLDLSTLNTSNVINMAYMFSGTGLSTFNCSLNTSKVTDMGAMFYGCPNLTSVNLTSFNTALVTDMHYMFQKCPALTTVDLSSFNTSGVNNMRGMFAAGYAYPGPAISSLANIYLSSSFTIPGGCDTTDMFDGCTNLPGYDPTKTDGTMLSTYTKTKPTPPPPPSADDRRYRGGSSGGGGGGGGRISLQNTNEIVLHTIKTNLISNYKIDGSYNFLSNDDGKTIVKKAWVNSDIHLPNSWYLVDNDGTVVTGFAKVSGKYYYFSPERVIYGMMLANTSISINGITYTLASDGTCASSNLPTNYYDIDFYLGGNKGLVTHNGYYYYFDDEGNICTGLYPLNDGLYYFQKDMPEKGKLICGDIFVDGVHYFCDPNAGGKARIIS